MLKALLSWIFPIVVILAVFLGGFTLYSNFILDYSLSNLEYALSVANQNPEKLSALNQSLHERLLKDMAIDELGNAENGPDEVILLNRASESLNFQENVSGRKKARLFIVVAQKTRNLERGILLRILDKLYFKTQGVIENIKSFFKYLLDHIAPKKKEQEIIYDYKSVLLISEAQDHEREFDFPGAENKYKEVLSLKIAPSDYALVQIALANVLIKQHKHGEAEKILNKIGETYSGKEISRAASQVLGRSKAMKFRVGLIERIKKRLNSGRYKKSEEDTLHLRLGLAYASSYQLSEAERELQSLVESKDDLVSDKALFYLGFISKVKNDNQKSKEVFDRLLASGAIEKEIELAARAELASIYEQNKQAEEALKQYQKVAEEAEVIFDDEKVKKAAWIALSEVEQAAIYQIDMAAPEKAQNALLKIDNLELISQKDNFLINFGSKNKTKTSLRDDGFRALQQKGDALRAYELFKKAVQQDPLDAWAYGGLATMEILFGHSKQALVYAKKGYELKSDEYTASIVAYIYQLVGRYQEASDYYGRSISKGDGYFPSQYNIACIYLEQKKYEQSLKLFQSIYENAGARNFILKAKVLNNMGVAYWHMSRLDEAIDSFHQALTLNPDMLITRENLDRITKQLGNKSTTEN